MNYDSFYEFLDAKDLTERFTFLNSKIKSMRLHGDYHTWHKILTSFPQIAPSEYDFSNRTIKIGSKNDLSDELRDSVFKNLKMLLPWRKGPYNLFGNLIDSEWRSDFKWERLKPFLPEMKDRTILDVGCGNGYHCWRMLGEGAKNVIGVDPYILSVFQFQVFKNYFPDKNIWVLPLKGEDVPTRLDLFDFVFSMGVLYHRRSPFDHITELKELVKEGGNVILETLIIDGKQGEVLVPEKRYAQMKNVWFIPSVLTLESWLRKVGFKVINLVDINQTTSEEQRKTEWVEWDSLENSLDPENKNLTVEGYPAPKRAMFLLSL